MNIIDMGDGVLKIRSLDVTDDVVIKYVGQLEAESRVAGVLNCLQLGAWALTFTSDQTGASLLADRLKTSAESAESLLSRVSTTAAQSVATSAETMGKTIEKLLADLSKDLGSKLDPANTASIVGRLRTTLVDDYQRVTEKVRQDLDLANPQSPLSSLRVELEKRFESLTRQFGEVVQELATRRGGSAERSKSTRKGGDFEVATEEFLTAESAPRKDLVQRTSAMRGYDQNLKGDFVIDVEPGQRDCLRIVLECKNDQKPATGRERVRELEAAMHNRDAVFGIAVVTEPAAIGEAIHAVGDSMLIVRVPFLPDGEGWDFMALGVALECARWKALRAQVVTGTLDINRVEAEIEAAFDVTNRFTEAKQKVTAGRSQLDGINECLEEMRTQLRSRLQRIREAITETSLKPKAA